MSIFKFLPDIARLAINRMVAVTEKEKKLLCKAMDEVAGAPPIPHTHDEYLPLDGSSPMTGDLDMNVNSITNVEDVQAAGNLLITAGDSNDLTLRGPEGLTLNTGYFPSTVRLSINKDGDLAIASLAGTGNRLVQTAADGTLTSTLALGIDRSTSPLTYATVFSNISVNKGLVTSVVTRTLTPNDIGAAPNGHSHSSYLKTDGSDVMTGYLDMGTNGISNVGSLAGSSDLTVTAETSYGLSLIGYSRLGLEAGYSVLGKTTIDLTENGNITFASAGINVAKYVKTGAGYWAFMAPVMVGQYITAAKDLIPSPEEGMVVYDATLKKLSFYNGTSWETVTST